MILTPDLRQSIIATARSYIGTPKSPAFNCVDFVRKVLATNGIVLPLINPYTQPPIEWGIKDLSLCNDAFGEIIFLKRILSQSDRPWTHVALVVSQSECIHCSSYFGRQVSKTSFEDLFTVYRFVPSGVC